MNAGSDNTGMPNANTENARRTNAGSDKAGLLNSTKTMHDGQMQAQARQGC